MTRPSANISISIRLTLLSDEVNNPSSIPIMRSGSSRLLVRSARSVSPDSHSHFYFD